VKMRDPSVEDTTGTVILKRWSLELVKVKSGHLVPVVRGRRNDAGAKGGSTASWRTSEIIEAHSPTVLRTRTQIVVQLVGPLSCELAAKLGLPQPLVVLFSKGFPMQTWKSHVQTASVQPTGEQAAGFPGSDCALVAHDIRTAGVDWIRSLMSIPTSASRFRCLPCLRPDVAGAQLLFRALNGLWAANATRIPRPPDTKCVIDSFSQRNLAAASAIYSITGGSALFGIGHDIRRLFRDGWFVGRCAAVGLDQDEVPCLLIAYRDGFFDLLPHAQALDACRHMRLRPLQRAEKIRQACGRPQRHTRPSRCQVGGLPATIPRQDGPRRAKQVRKILADRCFGSSQDCLEPVAAAASTSSPGSLLFLSSLHTGCTPRDKVSLSRKLFECSAQALEPGADIPASALKDLSDDAWQPAGLDGYICGALAKRSHFAPGHADTLRQKRPCRGLALTMTRKAAIAACRAELRDDAANLFKQVDDALAESVAKDVELGEMSPCESENEMGTCAMEGVEC